MTSTVAALLMMAGAAAPAQAPLSWADKMFKAGTSHDFGNVARGAQLFHQFKFTNIYAVPLEIRQTRTSCGCVTVTPSVRVVEPRQEATIDVIMDARKFTGPKTVHIYITVGPDYVSTATLTLSANSRTDVVFNPGQVSFGVVARGQTPTQTVDVEYAGVLDWKVIAVEKGNAPLEVSFAELYRRPGQVGYRVTVTLKAEAPTGPLRQEILLRTNDPASPSVPLLVEGTIQAMLSVAPGTLRLGSVRVGEIVKPKLIVRGGRPFRIVEIEGLGDGLQADWPGQSAAVHVLTLSYQPTKPGELKRQLRIKTDLTGEGPVSVTVEALASD